jgi:hypothetical protein
MPVTDKIEISNDGPAITRTSYWRTPHARRGLLYLSINAATLRLLVPPKIEQLLRDLPPVGRPLTLTRAQWSGVATYVFQWDEPAETGLEPYSIDIDQRQCDRALSSDEDGRVLSLVWYTQLGVWAVREARREQVQIGELVAS